jgi:hypothetical protein
MCAMQFRAISVESQQFPVEVCCRYRTCRELLAVRTIAITFRLEHQKNTTGVRSSCRFCIQVFTNFPWVTRQIPWREESITA